MKQNGLFNQSAFLIKVLILGAIAYGLSTAQTVWDGTANTAWYTSNSSAAEFTITTAEQLAGLADLVNGGNNFSGKTIKLGSNITLNETGSGWNSLTDNTTGFIQWASIGKYSPQLPFSGTFDGNGYIIKGVYFSDPSATFGRGLFGFLGTGGIIKNLGVTASYVKGSEQVGGLVGRNGGTVVNCYISNGTAVDGSDDIGGLVGGNYGGTIYNCYAVAIVQSKQYYGALGGYNLSGTVTASFWDKTVHNSTFGLGAGKTTVEMQAQQFTDDLNFSAGVLQLNKWQFNSGYYPDLLSNQFAPDPSANAFQNGSGTEAFPYIITTVAELNAVSSFTKAGIDFQGKFFKLAANIAINDTTNWGNWTASVAPANSWIKTGTFNGTFDGDGHTVRGVYINAAGSQGLFDTLGVNGTIKNLGVIASYINGGDKTGGLAAFNRGKVINCYFRGKVTAGSYDYVGGLVGRSATTGSIENCYSTGAVTGGGTSYGGGLVGGGSTASLEGTVSNGYYDENSTKSDARGVKKTTASMKIQQFTDDLNYISGGLKTNKWQFNANDYPTLMNGVIAEDPAVLAFQSGDGTENNPFIIVNDVQLNSFRRFVNDGRNFDGQFVKLGANINLNNTTGWENWETAAPDNAWTPIGNTEALAFKGTFDGDGHTVSGVYISAASNYQGLFGWLSGTVKNLGVTKSYIKGASYNGGLVGRALQGAAIYDSYFDGKVTGTSASGGIVGWVFGRNSAGTSPSIVIRGCHSAGEISVTGTTSSNNYAGGLVGHNQNSVLIDNCYSTATVTGYLDVGGLTGSNYNGYSYITNSHFSGSVVGDSSVGGIVGLNYGEISDSYFTGNVTARAMAGGLAGRSVSAKINNSYSAGTVSGTHSVGGI
ncbi:MAG: hypothetical protein FWF51_07230, partial [Chitinivibrionia bacterium]|nr:hypothetical protein [Chitinivibrionia bacterium]